MREIESAREMPTGRLGLRPATPGSAGRRALSGPREQGATGPHGMRLRHRGLFAGSTRIQFPWLLKPCGEPSPRKNHLCKRKRKKERGDRD